MVGRVTPVLTARQIPEIRAELVSWLTDPNGGPMIWSRHSDGARAEHEVAAARRAAVHLREGELYYVAEDMTSLARSAGASLPSYRLHEQDLPAESGLVVWQKPITERLKVVEMCGCPVIAASWGMHRGGVEVRWWVHRDDWLVEMTAADPALGLDAMNRSEAARLRQENPAAVVAMMATHMRFGERPSWLSTTYMDTPTDERADPAQWESDLTTYSTITEQMERTLVSTWLLMGQTLVREQREPAGRASARRIARISPSLQTEVRYVQLRHAKADEAETVGSSGASRAYAHQWVVSGHWRNHYFPSRNDHRPIWIAPHLKGPDGAPVLDPGKLVHVLRR